MYIEILLLFVYQFWFVGFYYLVTQIEFSNSLQLQHHHTSTSICSVYPPTHKQILKQTLILGRKTLDHPHVMGEYAQQVFVYTCVILQSYIF